MKKYLALLLALVLCLSVAPMMALADGSTYIVAGSDGLCGSSWDAADTANQLTLDSSDGLYKITYASVAAGTYQFKITDGTWSNSWPSANYEFTLSSAASVTITFNADTEEINVISDGIGEKQALEITSVSLAGDGEDAWLGGSSWGFVAMTETSAGVYTYSCTNVPLNDSKGHQFKIVLNDSWDTSIGANYDSEGTITDYDGSSNIWFALSYDYSDITITFDTTEMDLVNLTGAKITVTVTETAGESSPEETEATEATEATEETEATEATEAATEATTEEASTVTKIYVSVPDDWENPTLWAWLDGGDNAFDAWPGDATTLNSNGYWVGEIPNWCDRIIVAANDGSYQTADLTITAGAKAYTLTVTVDEAGIASCSIVSGAPQTGDITPFVAGSLLALGALGIVALVVVRKRFF